MHIHKTVRCINQQVLRRIIFSSNMAVKGAGRPLAVVNLVGFFELAGFLTFATLGAPLTFTFGSFVEEIDD